MKKFSSTKIKRRRFSFSLASSSTHSSCCMASSICVKTSFTVRSGSCGYSYKWVMMFVRFEANGNADDTNWTSMLEWIGLFPTLKDWLRPSNFGQVASMLLCFAAVCWVPLGSRTRVYALSTRCKAGKRPGDLQGALKVIQIADVDYTLVGKQTSFLGKLARSPIQFWRSMACHSREQMQQKLCKRWCCLPFFMEWVPSHTGHMCALEKTRGNTILLRMSKRRTKMGFLALNQCLGVTALDGVVPVDRDEGFLLPLVSGANAFIRHKNA